MTPPLTTALPYHYLPLAAGWLAVFVVAVGQMARHLWLPTTVPTLPRNGASMKKSPFRNHQQQQSSSTLSTSSTLIRWLLLAIVSLICYSFVIGHLEGVLAKQAHAQFDPYRALQLSPATTNLTVITDAYRTLLLQQKQQQQQSSKQTKLQQQQAEASWRDATLAYRALTDETARHNWQRYGHPDGPLLTPWFVVAVPSYLWPNVLRPRSSSLSLQQEAFAPPKMEIPRVYQLAMATIYAILLSTILFQLFSFIRNYFPKRNGTKGSNDSAIRGDTDLSNDPTGETDEDLAWNELALLPNDFTYIAKHVSEHLLDKNNTSDSHWYLLTLLLTAPSNMKWARLDLRRIESIRAEKMKQKTPESTKEEEQPQQQLPPAVKNTLDFDALLNEGGWDNDDDDDNDDSEARKKEQQAELEKQQELKQLKSQQEKDVLLEDLHPGVLGQRWVERTLAGSQAWPPRDLGFLQNRTFEYQNKQVTALDHPAVRRMLCMICGRMNSQMLNSHSELIQAGLSKQIDQTYFQASLTFRNRMGMLLESTLRIASAVRSFRLAKIVVETVAIFKIGCQYNESTLKWFQSYMMQQYGCLLVLNVLKKSILPAAADSATADAANSANQSQTNAAVMVNENAVVMVDLERTYAEQFLRQKLMLYQKQGIPPQVGLQTYREGWFVTLRCKRLDGKMQVSKIDQSETALGHMKLDECVLAKFEAEDPKLQLLTSFPMSVMNVAQKTIPLKIPFQAPPLPGQYLFTVELFSLDFLASSVLFTITHDVEERKENATKLDESEESKKEK